MPSNKAFRNPPPFTPHTPATPFPTRLPGGGGGAVLKSRRSSNNGLIHMHQPFHRTGRWNASGKRLTPPLASTRQHPNARPLLSRSGGTWSTSSGWNKCRAYIGIISHSGRFANGKWMDRIEELVPSQFHGNSPSWRCRPSLDLILASHLSAKMGPIRGISFYSWIYR